VLTERGHLAELLDGQKVVLPGAKSEVAEDVEPVLVDVLGEGPVLASGSLTGEASEPTSASAA
jgi:hypothetical protein